MATEEKKVVTLIELQSLVQPPFSQGDEHAQGSARRFLWSLISSIDYLLGETVDDLSKVRVPNSNSLFSFLNADRLYGHTAAGVGVYPSERVIEPISKMDTYLRGKLDKKSDLFVESFGIFAYEGDALFFKPEVYNYLQRARAIIK